MNNSPYTTVLNDSALSALWGLIEEYLETLPDDDGEEVYLSYRDHAEDELEKFAGWLEDRFERRPFRSRGPARPRGSKSQLDRFRSPALRQEGD